MAHSRVDGTTNNVEEYYRGDFLVNDDWEYSQALAKKYQAQYANRFIGTNGKFEAGKMFCTENCSREENRIRIPADGTVFGPYFAFPAGDYAAVYDLTGDLPDGKVEVSSQTVGRIASGNAEDLLRNGKVVLPFSLPEEISDLELKTINSGSGEIIFNKVSVSDHLESIQGENTVRLAEYETDNPEKGEEDSLEEKSAGRVVGAYIQELYDIQRGDAAAYRGLQVAAECTLPQRTRFHAIKRFLRKLMNCFIAFQLDFNRRIAAIFGDQNRQVRLLAASIAEGLSEIQQSESEKIEQLDRKIALQNEQIFKLQEQLQNLEMARQEQEYIRRNEERLNALENELSALADSIGDINVSAERLDKAEYNLQELAESVNGSCANDTRLEEIGRMWARIEDAIKLLHDCARKQG